MYVVQHDATQRDLLQRSAAFIITRSLISTDIPGRPEQNRSISAYICICRLPEGDGEFRQTHEKLQPEIFLHHT